MTEFQKKRIEYFKKAAQNYDWVRLGLGDVGLLSSINTDEIVKGFNFQAGLAQENNNLKEEVAHHLRRIERLKRTIKYLNSELKACTDELGNLEE